MNSNSSTPMIEISNLKKSYGDFQALKGISFNVPKGQVVGFLGPNGAGKSTTMRIITSYLPYEGSVKIKGYEVAKNSDITRSLIGYLPENNPQYEDMMVYEYLCFIANIRNIPKNLHKDKIDRVVELCGLSTVVHKDISQLSKGFRQRVGLAQAIIHEPELLILDEPTSGLDPNQIIEIRNLIADLGKTTTVLMSTHIMQEAQSTCERIIIINDGMLAADDYLDKLSSKDSGLISLEVSAKNKESFDASTLTKELLKIDGISSIDKTSRQNDGTTFFEITYQKDPRDKIFKTIVDADLILWEMSRKKASLEETFKQLTTKR